MQLKQFFSTNLLQKNSLKRTSYRSRLHQLRNQSCGIKQVFLKREMTKVTFASEASKMVPLIAEWKGQKTPGIPFFGRRGQLFFWNPFGDFLLPDVKDIETYHNFNACIAGQGRHILMNEIVTTVLGVGGKALVIDFDRNFKHSCRLFGGDYIDLNAGSNICFNPFSKIPDGMGHDEILKREEMLSMIESLLQVMVSPQSKTSDLQNAYIWEAVEFAWTEKQAAASIDVVSKYLMTHEQKEAQKIGEALSSFSSSGSLGHFFNQSDRYNFENPFTVFGMDEFKKDPDLLSILIQMVIFQFHQFMSKQDCLKPFAILIDNTQRVFGGNESFLSYVTRAARKLRGSYVFGTQDLTDWIGEESQNSGRVFEMAAWKCILTQDPDVINPYFKQGSLFCFTNTEFKEDLILSIHSNPPHYSEVLIYGPEVNGYVGRLSLDPYSRLLYSMNPKEYDAIENHIKGGATIDEAIEMELARERQQEQDTINAA